MPIYEYECKACGERFEKLVRSMGARDEATACPKCSSKQTARALSVVAAISSGEGAAKGSSDPMCGRCGGAPGSCGMG